MENKLNKISFRISNLPFLIKNNKLYIKKNNRYIKFVIKNVIIKTNKEGIDLYFNSILWDKSNFNKVILEFSNLLRGFSKGFSVILKFNGVGYRILSNNLFLKFKIGLNKPALVKIPKGIKVNVLNRTTFCIIGEDLKKTQNFVHKIRNIRKLDVYKAKGIQYSNEIIKLKTVRKVL